MCALENVYEGQREFRRRQFASLFSLGICSFRFWYRFLRHVGTVKGGMSAWTIVPLGEISVGEDGDAFHLVVRDFPIAVVISAQP